MNTILEITENLKNNFRILLTKISPELNTRVTYLMKFRRPINLKHPATLDEKIQWMKLQSFEKDPLIKQCVDKLSVRDYVKESGCEGLLNELYYVWDSVDDIPWDELPNQFVIKWNFGCGQNLICKDKSKLNIQDAMMKLQKWYEIHDTFYLQYSEMQYRGIKPKLICEKLISTKDGLLPLDYKLYCFHGEAKFVMLCTERETGHAKYYFFDRAKKLVRINKRGLAAPDGFTIPMPEEYDMLFDYAEKLSKPFPFVRADFYLEEGHVIFGELTFTPCGGYDVNIPRQQNEWLGSMLHLPIDE